MRDVQARSMYERTGDIWGRSTSVQQLTIFSYKENDDDMSHVLIDRLYSLIFFFAMNNNG